MTWNLKRSCIFVHWIQLPILFEVNCVFWILHVSCSARRLLVCLSVRFVCTELSCFSPQALVGLRRNFHHRCDYSCRIFCMMSKVTWCGSHFGKTEKLWTSVSLKLHQGKKFKLGKDSCGISVIFLNEVIVAFVMTSIAFVERYIWSAWIFLRVI